MKHDNRNRGAIWKNEDKVLDTDADFRGRLNVDGAEFWVSAWKRRPDANPKAPALSFTVRRKDAKPPAAAPDAVPASAWGDESDIPF